MLEKLRQLFMHNKFFWLHGILKQKDPRKQDKSTANHRKEREAAKVYDELVGLLHRKEDQALEREDSVFSVSVKGTNLYDHAPEERERILEVIKLNFHYLILNTAGS